MKNKLEITKIYNNTTEINNNTSASNIRASKRINIIFERLKTAV